MKHARIADAFTIPIRIYYEDTDAGGVVYYANYLKFLERCRTEYLRSLGHEQANLLRDAGIAFVVRSVNLEYLKPARLDDLLTVSVEVEKTSRSQIFVCEHIRLKNTLAPEGWDELLNGRFQIVCVCVDAATGQMKVTSIPAAMRAQLEAIQ